MTNNYRFFTCSLVYFINSGRRALAKLPYQNQVPCQISFLYQESFVWKIGQLSIHRLKISSLYLKLPYINQYFFIYSFTFKTKGFPKTKYRFITITNKIIYKKPLLASIFSFIFKKTPSNEIITKHTKSKYTL